MSMQPTTFFDLNIDSSGIILGILRHKKDLKYPLKVAFSSSLMSSRSGICAINHCQIAHQALFLSDISTGWGDRIGSQFTTPPKVKTQSSWNWPPERPSKSDWKIWSDFLQNSVATSNLYLVDRLGHWRHPSHRQDIVPYEPTTCSAFIKGQGSYWVIFRGVARPSYGIHTLRRHSTTTQLPSSFSYARILSHRRNILILQGFAPYTPSSSPPVLPPYLSQLSFLSKDLQPLILSIRAGTALGVSDGSHMPQQYPALATAGWILSDNICSDTSICCGVSQVPGHETSINAYRAELHGLHTLLSAIEFICTKFNITQGHVTIGCDNKGAIYQVANNYSYIPCSTKHADLICAIHNLKRRCPISLSFKYVAGHQDELARLDELPPLARLNVTADNLARPKEVH